MRRLHFVLPLWLGCTGAHAVEIMQWERLPLAVPLYVDQERIIFIDQNVRVGVPRGLADSLRIQSAGGALYLRASAPIAPTRLQLQDVRTGEIILIDVTASTAEDQLPLEPVKIVKSISAPSRYGDDSTTSNQAVDSSNDEHEQTPSSHHQTPLPVVITRYAAQNLYAPLRTVEPLPGVAQIKTQREINLNHLIPMQPVVPSLLGAWQLDDHYVTVVELRNTSSDTLKLDPRVLQADLVSATFQHHYLGPSGLATDTTVAYLVTRGKSLAQAITPAISRINASSNLKSLKGGAHAE
ncbi:TIGR03749 family integrating conjugative element protein [Pseudomonas synxantha]|uniref:TIGR03749 family integrating conjugative element protein n=1 Tax=Pseudomonas synxantha TaxID=47883 RepID=UPI0023679685|nr:TIGR03749 family integrating conjugative element protein [Pseudomonas synxantha]WDG40846.1 TIGR03749 family integrating conjugative element protein [Pseudomonas synxantha]